MQIVAGPGRPREFDIETAVRDAIEVFRARGYHGASVQDLTEGTGLARGSLYKAFHDKRSLFLAALEHYSTASLRRLGEDLAAPGPAREAIRQALLGYARRATGELASGCLITGAAMELIPEDAEVAAIIARSLRRMRDLFAAAVIRGQAAGELPTSLDERGAAGLLLTTLQGLRVLGRTGASLAELEPIIETAMQVIRD